MTEEEVKSFLQLYDYSPTLVLFENLLNANHSEETETISAISGLTRKDKLNPIDVVLESVVNVVSEDISRRKLTHSKDKVLINSNIRNLAVKEILKFIDNDKMKLEKLHHLWLDTLRAFLSQLYQENKNMKIDEVIFLVGNHFRISALSTIKAIVSISH